MREVHPDNDSGILNDLLWRYCRRYRIQMSRSRPYQKNDNAWVEQKNRTHVRQVVGHRRLTTGAQCELLEALYEADFRNFFQPSMKLKEKVRAGAKCGGCMRCRARPISGCWSWGNSSRRSGGRWRTAAAR
jgi:hypothetical protein